MKISFAAGFAPVVESLDDSTALYADALGLPFDDPSSDHPMTNRLDGLKYFGLWTLNDCAQSCFGTDEWPADRIKPQGCIEFDVESAEAVSAAAEELAARGYALLVAPRTEPWGQTVTRLQTPEGLLVGVTYTPWLQG